MQYWTLAFCLISSFYAFGACDDVFSYSDKNVYISASNDCYKYTKLYIRPIKNGKMDDKLAKELDFNVECPRNIKRGFTCRINKQNPLSGASYVFLKIGTTSCPDVSHEPIPVYGYKCVSGCMNKPIKLSAMMEGCE